MKEIRDFHAAITEKNLRQTAAIKFENRILQAIINNNPVVIRKSFRRR